MCKNYTHSAKVKGDTMSNCNICGRKTQTIQRNTIKSGKYSGWIKIVHRCETHGNFDLRIRPPIGDKE